MYKLSVAKLERGIREPSWTTAQTFADGLGVGCEAFGLSPALSAGPREAAFGTLILAIAQAAKRTKLIGCKSGRRVSSAHRRPQQELTP